MQSTRSLSPILDPPAALKIESPSMAEPPLIPSIDGRTVFGHPNPHKSFAHKSLTPQKKAHHEILLPH